MLEQMKVPELKEMAKQLGIESADSMKKAELIEAISKKQAESPEKDIQPKESSNEKSDYASHPKFAKFISSQGAD